MSDQQWDFWLDQLAGKNPALPSAQGQPAWGFYLSRRRYTWQREPHERKIGGSRNKTITLFWPTAIWGDEDGWHCLITRAPVDGKTYKTAHIRNPNEIDEQIFCSCCRAAITHENYLHRVADLANDAAHRSGGSWLDHAGLYLPMAKTGTFTRGERMAAEDAARESAQ